MSDGTGNLAREHLRAFIERIERLEEEKATLMEDIREVYAEAKGTGFDPKIMRQVIRIRKLEPDQRQEQEFVLGHLRTLTCADNNNNNGWLCLLGESRCGWFGCLAGGVFRGCRGAQLSSATHDACTIPRTPPQPLQPQPVRMRTGAPTTGAPTATCTNE